MAIDLNFMFSLLKKESGMKTKNLILAGALLILRRWRKRTDYVQVKGRFARSVLKASKELSDAEISTVKVSLN